MKDRLLTLALAVGALAACYLFLFPKPVAPNPALSLPVTTDSGPHGYLAAWRWLKTSQLPVSVLRNRYDRLTDPGLAARASGNVLLSTMPYQLPASSKEAAPLNAWIDRGNTLVVMAALDDTPDWAASGGKSMEDTLNRVMRLKLVALPEPTATANAARSPAADATPPKSAQAPTLRERVLRLVEQTSAVKSLRLAPSGDHPLMNGVASIAAYSELPADRWAATPTDAGALLGIAGLEPDGDAAIWLKRQGNGQLLVIGVASAFSNRAIGEADNARFLANIIAWCRAPDGTVIFDDAHQGAVGYYDPKAFFADPRLHRTLAWILALWFVFVLGAQTLRVQDSRWRPVDVTAFVGASGDFFAGLLAPSAAADRLLSNFFNSLRRRLGLPEDGAPVWEWLAAQAGISAHELAESRRQHTKAAAGQRVDLVRLQNLLSRMQGAIQ
ncbi:MAG: DUF4350 domain-containing protein [Steroidobacteraceae bacterium]